MSEQSLYFHNGISGARFAAPTRIVWALNKKLNRAGQSQIYVPYSAPELDKLGEDFILPGTLLYAEDDAMGVYTGVLIEDTEWDNDGISIDVMGPEYLAAFRTTPDTRVTLMDKPAGAIFSQLVQWMSQEETSLVKLGDIAMGGPHIQRTFSTSNIYSELCKLSDDTGYDWEFVPVLEGTNLYFKANFYERKGRTITGLALKDGINLDRNVTNFRTSGPIANQVHATGVQSASGAEAPRAVQTNSDSRSKYGLRQYGITTNASEASTNDTAAAAYAKANGFPRKEFTLEAINKDNILAEIRVGDVITLSSPKYDFAGKVRGTLRSVRIVATTLYSQSAKIKRMPLEVVVI